MSSIDEAEPLPTVDTSSTEADTSSAEALLTALLIVDTDSALAAARQLLDRSWPGTDQLSKFVATRLNDLDPLGQLPWKALRR